MNHLGDDAPLIHDEFVVAVGKVDAVDVSLARFGGVGRSR